MVNPAVIAGLVAGYTVSAVVTALLAAEDPGGLDHGADPTDVARQRPSTRCPGALRHSRRAARCIVRRIPNRTVTAQRR